MCAVDGRFDTHNRGSLQTKLVLVMMENMKQSGFIET